MRKKGKNRKEVAFYLRIYLNVHKQRIFFFSLMNYKRIIDIIGTCKSLKRST